MNALLLYKATLAPLLVIGATLAGRRWGQTVAGFVAGFPIVAGPILYFLAREQGALSAAISAKACLLGIISFSFFALAYSWRAWSGGTVISCLLLSWVGFAAGTALVNRVQEPGLWACLAWALGALFLARRSLPPVEAPVEGLVREAWDLPLRGLAAAALVLGLTHFAEALGPRLSGFLTPFPVASTVLAVFAQRQGGGAAAQAVLKGLLLAMNSFAVFCLGLCLTLPTMSVAASFGLSLAAAGAVQALLFQATRKR